MTDRPATRVWAARWHGLGAVLVTGVVAALFAPVLAFELMGDDYQMVQLAHRASLHPLRLLAPIGQFFRPVSTWALALDLAVWDHHPAGFHLSNLIFVVAAGCLLAAAARRLGLHPAVAWSVAVLWVVSPFAEENAVSVAIRHETFLLAAWLGIVAVWPRDEERWGWARAGIAIVCGLLAMASKETWVVTPGLVLVLAWCQQGWRWRRGVLPATLATVAAGVFVIVRFALIPTTGGYFVMSPRPLLKVLDLAAAFLRLERLRPGNFEVTGVGLLAFALLVTLVVLGLRWRLPAVATGGALLWLPLLPVALVPYLPQRYAAIPYAGFLLVVAGLAQHLVSRRLAGRAAHGVVVALGAVGVLVVAVDVATVRADLVDWETVSAGHSRLLAEAARVVGVVESGLPAVIVRAESVSPIQRVVAAPVGLPKVMFVRGGDPYGLVDTAALFEWVAGRRDLLVDRYDDWQQRFAGVPGVVLVHREGGFEVAGPTADVAAAARRWAKTGLAVQVIETHSDP